MCFPSFPRKRQLYRAQAGVAVLCTWEALSPHGRRWGDRRATSAKSQTKGPRFLLCLQVLQPVAQPSGGVRKGLALVGIRTCHPIGKDKSAEGDSFIKNWNGEGGKEEKEGEREPFRVQQRGSVASAASFGEWARRSCPGAEPRDRTGHLALGGQQLRTTARATRESI